MNDSSPSLKAVLINCTLKRSPEGSHTQSLLDVVRAIFEANQVAVTVIRPVDFEIAPGVFPDMTEHGTVRDDWPKISQQVMDSDILVLGSPIWLGSQSSVATRVVERLYAHSGETNDRGQYVYYGKTGGCVVTGNEDGIKHVAMSLLYALGHIGFTIPPQADCGWIGEAGPGPSYGDSTEGGPPAGFDNDFTNRNTTFMAWNLIHMARLLKKSDGIPAQGNVPADWKAGTDMNFPRPEYR